MVLAGFEVFVFFGGGEGGWRGWREGFTFSFFWK